MPVTTNAFIKNEDKFISPFRMILSGFVYYYHPCYLDEPPVDWHESMNIPVSYQTGLPSVEQLTSMPPNSLLVLDDLMEKCVTSEVIDHLFRVISGKKKISVMIMAQNYFVTGRFSRNIKNSCNYSVLMRNCCDATINSRAARAMNLTKPVAVAEQSNAEKEYPYIFIDQTQKGQVSGYQIYTDIFGDYKKCYSNVGMPSYIVPEKDFLAVFQILQQKNRFVLATEKNADEIRETVQPCSTSTKSTTETVPPSREYSRRQRKRSKRY